MNKIFAILFILTGIFAIVGGLYTWGAGSIFSQTELLRVLIPFTDIILTGPISLFSGYSILRDLNRGRIFGLITSGIYIYGSFLVFITILWNNDYSAFLIVPSISGFLIGAGYVAKTIKERAIN